jgi:2-hydroxychromene-2-carboxylate isomerase
VIPVSLVPSPVARGSLLYLSPGGRGGRKKTVEFHYGLVSPYSYLACGEISRICRGHGAELAPRPMLLGAVHDAVGLQTPIETEPKACYQARDIRRWAGLYGLPMA